MRYYALIVAGGTGTRMGSGIPKQFLELAGKPVLMHTIERFRSFDETVEIIVALPQSQTDYWKSLLKEYSFTVPHKVISGGRSRFHTVKNGLDLIGGQGLVAIHDGVRPLVSRETIRRCFETAEKYGNAVPVISPADSVRMTVGQSSIPLNRTDIKIIQTPQVFETGLLRNAYRQDYDPAFTDDATVLERTGAEIHLVEGNRENIKITNPEDLVISSALLPFIS